MGVSGRQNSRRGGAILTPNELVLTFGGFYVCANFSENRSRNATVRVPADGQIHRHTDRRKPSDEADRMSAGRLFQGRGKERKAPQARRTTTAVYCL